MIKFDLKQQMFILTRRFKNPKDSEKEIFYSMNAYAQGVTDILNHIEKQQPASYGQFYEISVGIREQLLEFKEMQEQAINKVSKPRKT